MGKETNGVIWTVLGIRLILPAVATLLQKQIAIYAKAHERLGDEQALMPTVVLGIILGAVVSISSVGAGAIGVTVLLTLYPALRVARIVGTDIAHAVPLTLVAGFGHWLLGGVDPLLLLNLLIGSIPGVIIGSMISTRSADHILRPVLASVLLISGVRLLLCRWKPLPVSAAPASRCTGWDQAAR